MPDQQAPSLTAALIALQSALPRITKNDEAQVGTRTYAYANLATIHDAVLPLLGEHHLAWVCRPTLLDTGVFVLAYSLMHEPSGEHQSGNYPLPSSGTPQQVGSAITYARRYTLTAVLGIAPAEDDDDAQAAEAAARTSPRAAADPGSGRMSRGQAREHNRVIGMDAPPRPADRLRGRLPDDEFSTPADEEAPGSITDQQRARLMAAYGRAGIGARADRLAFAMSVLDLPELASSNDLSMRQAGLLIAKLESSGEGGS